MRTKSLAAVFVVVALGAVVVLASACGYDGPRIDVEELKAALDDPRREMVVIDVRQRVLFDKGHVQGALHLDLEGVERELEPVAAKGGEVVVICTCGKKALVAAKRLAKVGITVTFVEGGMKAWEAAGYAQVAEVPGKTGR